MTKPAVVLPPEARKRLKEEAESIKRCYKQPLLRMQALDLAIDRIREEFPHAFRHERTQP